MRTQAVTLTRDLGELGQEVEIEFLVRFFPGTPPAHLSGCPEDFDPGCADEVNIVSAMVRFGKTMIDLTPIYQQDMPGNLYEALCVACNDNDARRRKAA